MQGANLRGAQVAWDYLEQAAFSKDLLKETSMCSFFFFNNEIFNNEREVFPSPLESLTIL